MHASKLDAVCVAHIGGMCTHVQYTFKVLALHLSIYILCYFIHLCCVCEIHISTFPQLQFALDTENINIWVKYRKYCCALNYAAAGYAITFTQDNIDNAVYILIHL